jgi:hypothetical protein
LDCRRDFLGVYLSFDIFQEIIMAPQKYDGIIETVRYSPDGLIKMVRIYERRGPTFSDRILISREELVTRIKEGKKYLTGKRVRYLASTFETDESVNLVKFDQTEYLVTQASSAAGDNLGSLPVF